MRLFLLLIALSVTDEPSTEPPPELLAAQSYRTFLNGRVEYLIAPAPETIPVGFPREPRLLQCQFNGGDLLGTVAAQHSLLLDGKLFSTTPGKSLSCGMWDLENPSVPLLRPDDIRGLGLTPFRNDLKLGLDRMLWETAEDNGGSEGPRTYSVEDRDGLRVVTCRLDESRQVQWWIDPARDYAVERAQYLSDGQVLREARSSYVERGGCWYPESTAYYDSRHKDGQEPELSVTVRKASFNDTSQQPLSLKDIGVEVGTNVRHILADGRLATDANGRPLIYTWDGGKLTGFSEVKRAVEEGRMKLGPSVAAEIWRSHAEADAYRMLGMDPLSAPLIWERASRLSYWEEYTADFIRRFQLDADQSQRAWAICSDCTSEARKYVLRWEGSQSEFERLEVEARAIPDTSPGRQRAVNKLVQRKVSLQEPIVKIFQNRLKPRLYTIPTPLQKAAAPSSAEDQPAPAAAAPAKKGK